MAKALIEKPPAEKGGVETSVTGRQSTVANQDVTAMAFEQAMAELETIVDRLEKGSVPLEESITIYERGEALKKHCDGLLKAAEQRIEKITLGSNGVPNGTSPLDVE